LLDSKLHFASQNDLQNASQNALSILQQQQFNRIASAVCYSSTVEHRHAPFFEKESRREKKA